MKGSTAGDTHSSFFAQIESAAAATKTPVGKTPSKKKNQFKTGDIVRSKRSVKKDRLANVVDVDTEPGKVGYRYLDGGGSGLKYDLPGYLELVEESHSPRSRLSTL